MKFKKTLGTILVAMFLAGGCRDKPIVYEYEYFRGNSGNYGVRIDLGRSGSKVRRIVHLDGKADDVVPYGVTGHDYDGDKKWDRIFIQETVNHGCNAVYFNRRGEVVWEPCPADEDKVKQFTGSQINEARNMLNKATEDFEKPEYKRE